jgi:hypothetical protein
MGYRSAPELSHCGASAGVHGDRASGAKGGADPQPLGQRRGQRTMITRDLDEVDRLIFEARQHINRQYTAIQIFRGNGQTMAIAQSEDQLKMVEDRLFSLHERRKTILQERID